ncbi:MULTISPECIES: hypothetical protein [Pseudomonas]|uniref:Uncharacterized protein n=1 Tax=Pseudomonas lutea TaxID=243924 RepID=A0A9X8QLS5_9PSED|nr:MULTISPECIES: hypothetical protein [Pseudomonas]SER37951.1 hypothetical protein SAMN05216409_118118 [Pseudomonas lutea]
MTIYTLIKAMENEAIEADSSTATREVNGVTVTLHTDLRKRRAGGNSANVPFVWARRWKVDGKRVRENDAAHILNKSAALK